MWATLIDKFHLRPWEVAKLTDRQIHDLYYHPRNDDGTIEPVEPLMQREPKTLNEAMIQFECVAQMLRMKPEQIAEQKQKLRQKWAKEEVGTAGLQ